jgi:hypothetical protein
MSEKFGSVRKRFNPAQRNKILADYESSDLTQQEFAARSGISLSCLSLWLRRQRQASACSSPAEFLEIPLAPSASGAPAGYKIHLPGGVFLELPRGFSPEEARQLLQLARSV